MIAGAFDARPGRPSRERMAAIDRALATLSRAQDLQAADGRQHCYSQAEISRRTGLTRSRVEQLETAAKLRFLKNLATAHPESLLELGGTYAQLAFLKRMRITSTNTRRLWRRWVDLGRQTDRREARECEVHCSSNTN